MINKKYFYFILILLLVFSGYSLYIIHIKKPWEIQWEKYHENHELYLKNIKALEESIDKNISLIDGLQKKTNENKQATKENYNNINLNSKHIGSYKNINHKSWLLAEVKYLLKMANQKILISKDYSTSLSLVNTADEILSRQNDPQFMKLRGIIAEDRFNLASAVEFDMDGILHRLSILIERIDGLPLINEIKSIESEDHIFISVDDETLSFKQNLERILIEAWDHFRDLIVIRKISTPIKPILSEQQYVLLKTNIRLLLNQAKISLINIDQASYKNSLDELMILVAKSFPNHSTDVKNFMREIAALEGVDFDLLNININATLLELKKILDSNAEIINN